MNNYDYQIKIAKLKGEDGGGFVATVPELPGCMSDGDSYEEALKNIKGAINDWIETAKHRKQVVPEPTLFKDDDDYSGKLIIRIPRKIHKELSERSEEEGVSLNQLILSYLCLQLGYEQAKKELVKKEINSEEIGEVKERDNDISILSEELLKAGDWQVVEFFNKTFIVPQNKKGE